MSGVLGILQNFKDFVGPAVTAAWLNAVDSILGTQLSPTPAETAAGAVVLQGGYVPGVIERYATPTTTDFTVAVTASAGQAVQPGGAPMYGASTYLTTASIPNLHTAPKAICTGAIQRGSSLFFLFPTGVQINTLNISITGSDTNDGLGTGQPMASWQGAVNAYQNYQLALGAGGNAVIQSAAGTAIGSVTFAPGFWTKNPIQLLGVPGALPFTPTTIIQGGAAAPAAWVQNTPYAVGNQVTANGFTFVCIQAGTSANAGVGPSTATYNIADNTVRWNFYAPGDGAIGNGNNNVLIQDILFQNCNNAGQGFAMVFQGDSHGKLQLYHVFTAGCDNALKTQQMRLYLGQACWFEGGSGQAMVTSISNMTHTYGYNCTITAAVGGANKGQAGVGLYMHGHTVTGILVQEGATGHFDYSCSDNNAIGADITNASRLNCNFSAFGNNATCARRLREGSNWNDNGTGVNDTNNGTANLLDGGCGEFSRQGFWTIPRTQPVDLTLVTQTGVLGSTVVKTYANAIDLNSFSQKQQRFRVKVVGTTTGTTNTKNLTLNLDGSAVSGFTLAAASAGDFIWETVCNSNGAAAQSFDSVFNQNGVFPQTQQGSRSITLTAGTLTIAEIINGAGDTITIRAVYIWSEGGA